MNDFRQASILVVDDEKQIVGILVEYFKHMGHEVTGLSDPVEALELVKKHTFDIVFTDLMMPKITGMDIVETIKGLDRDTKIVVFTGYASVESAVNALHLGVHDYIDKPFHLDDIRKILVQAIDKLMLERENKALQEKLERMLQSIQILYNISTILYQISDPKSIIEMIFDTLSESMGFNKACFIQKPGMSEEFVITHSRAVSREVVDNFTFGLEDSIDGQKLSTDSIMIIGNEKGSINVAGHSLNMDPNIKKMYLVPILFLDKVTAFLCIFQDHESLMDVDENITTLLSILATQIAPISSTVMNPDSESFNSEKIHLSSTFKIINDEIEKAKATDSIVSFSMLRIKNQISEDTKISFPGLRDSWYDIVTTELGNNYQAYWDGDDSILIVAVGENQVPLEHHAASIRQKVELQYRDEDEKPGVTMAYGVCSYPYDGISGKQIHEKLRSTLFYSGVFGLHQKETSNG